MSLVHHIKSSFTSFASILIIAAGLTACGGDATEDLGFDEGDTAGSAGESGHSGGCTGSCGTGGNAAGTGGGTSTGGSAGTGAQGGSGPDFTCDDVTCEGGHCVMENDKPKCIIDGTGGSAGTSGTGGSAGEAGTGGSSGTGGSAGTGGAAGTGGTSGSGGSAGSGGTGGSAGTGGSSGSGGTSGQGGQAGAAGSGGSAGTGGSGGSAGTGGSGGSGGNTLGTLVITILSPIDGSHTLRILGDELPYRTAGSVTWQTPQADFTATGLKLVTSIQVAPGSKFVFNGVYDPPTSDPEQSAFWTHQFCGVDNLSPTGFAPTMPMAATFNGKPAARIVAKSNNKGGCNLEVVAAPSPLISSTDEDGDGVSPPQDCDDKDPIQFPGQIESAGDTLDTDCDNNDDPAAVTVRFYGAGSGVTPVVDSFGNGSYAMSWNPLGFYETAAIPKATAPKKFLIHWPQGSSACSYGAGTCYDSSFWLSDGSCHGDVNSVQMVDLTSNTPIGVTLQTEGNPAWTCRRVAAL